jgi:NAD(P)H-hydrate repair Nnr-like enzyme with NAD(P)H-hydrate dehydratase domain
VLKGNGSVVARPAGSKSTTTKAAARKEQPAGHAPRWWINPSGNPGMASAGMGDALGGLLAGLLAQGLTPLAALQLAVWLHGAAADELCAAGMGPWGITASDVIERARLILNRPR